MTGYNNGQYLKLPSSERELNKGSSLLPDSEEDPCPQPHSPLSFHPYVKGSQITMDQSHRSACRLATFHDGIVFSDRPVQPYEKVTLKILREDCRWQGGLRLGFTQKDPSRLKPKELPLFVCPNLVSKGETWACVLPEEFEGEGTVFSFWVNSGGSVFCSVNQGAECCWLFDGVPVTTPLWAVLDIYGRTKAVQLLDLSSAFADIDHLGLHLLNLKSTCGDLPARPEDSDDGEDCVVCCGSEANATMLPCCHSSFCSSCALKILHTSGCCPLCRRRVEKVLCSPARPQTNSHTKNWLEEAKSIRPPP